MVKIATDILYQTYKLLGQDIAKIVPFLSETSCMNPEVREFIALMKMYQKLFPEDKEFNEWLKKEVIPAFGYLGYAKWKRDVLTDLALKKGRKGEKDVSLKRE